MTISRTGTLLFSFFSDYFARVILCNSLVWTCSLTGKSGLTFQDAQESEEAARQWVRVFPRVLRRPALFVTDLTSRGRLADLVDDVFNFVKDRFFVGEELDYVYNNKRYVNRATTSSTQSSNVQILFTFRSHTFLYI